ncbi:hypothetical protein ACE3NQ_17425 [Paenibacillus terreus]|uniref:Uncharacterized protein n=1 Tax=Paenibacillus terreus TaxID=1387834 RepID=A0ABV5BAG6_9BACL
MIGKSDGLPIFKMVLEAVLGIFLIFFANLTFLGYLFITSFISEVLLYFAKKSSTYHANISTIGHYSYAASLAYTSLLGLLYYFDAINAQIAIYGVVYGLFLLFPIIALIFVKIR